MAGHIDQPTENGFNIYFFRKKNKARELDNIYRHSRIIIRDRDNPN